MKHLAVIPARSGSKGIPDKNIKPLAGKPLMAYSIEAAVKSGLFDEVLCSTDSEHYAEIARSYGASVPFLRSPETATDTAYAYSAVYEAIDRYHAMGRDFDTYCMLQPTSPLRNAQDIRDAYEIFLSKNANIVLSMEACDHLPVLCNHIGEDGSIEDFVPRGVSSRRQDYPAFYRHNGAIVIADIEARRKDPYMYQARSYAYVMPRERGVDIDAEVDFKYAEFLLREGVVKV